MTTYTVHLLKSSGCGGADRNCERVFCRGHRLHVTAAAGLGTKAQLLCDGCDEAMREGAGGDGEGKRG
jgi:hypothetical protein